MPSSVVRITEAQRLACARAMSATHLAFGRWSGLCPVGQFLDAHLLKVSQLVRIHGGNGPGTRPYQPVAGVSAGCMPGRGWRFL